MTKQHGPEPMTDAEIAKALLPEFVNPRVSDRLIADARAIEAAVNAQWREWLGKQEPVAYMQYGQVSTDRKQFGSLEVTPLYTHPAPKAEPVNQMLLDALKPFAVYGRVGSRDTEVAAAIAAIAAAEQAPQPAELTDVEILAANYPDGVENGETISRPDYELIAFGRQVLAAQGAKHG